MYLKIARLDKLFFSFTFIINDSLESAVKQLNAIVQKIDDTTLQQEAIMHARQLLHELAAKK